MKNKTVKFLISGIVCIFALCVVAFSLMTVLMNRRSADAIGDLGELYMAGMSEQAAKHFGTTIELRLSQVSALTDAVPPSSVNADDENRRDKSMTTLVRSAMLRNFSHVALLGTDGKFEMLNGAELIPDDASVFLDSLRIGEAMAVGSDRNGERLIIMGIPADYPMESGEKSVGLVVALPITYISDTLSLDVNKEMIDYYIIDRNGGFIIKNDNVTEDNYFQRILDRYEGVDGMTNERFLENLKESMSKSKNYTAEIKFEGERRYLYCTSLPFSDWYLILFIQYGQIDETIGELGDSWTLAAVLSCLAILIALGVVFALYLRNSHKQMRELEEAKRIAEYASKAKSEFLSNMSHDIRTPMNGIVGMTAIASSNIDNPQQVKSCLKKIDLSSRHLLGLINDILDMSKIESGKLELHAENLSLPEAIRSVINIAQPQATAKSQNFEVYVRNIFCEQIICDRVRFSQILVNLLGNAVKFTPEGGNITLTCREQTSDKGDGFVRLIISVKDTGIGMTDEFQKKIFDAFAREDTGRVQKTEGTGLGMAITKYIVDAMHGTINVESKLNVGSEFRVEIDFEKASECKELDLERMRALVIDEDKTSCDITTDELRSLGCVAESAYGVQEALAVLRDKAEFDVILITKAAAGDGYSAANKIANVKGGGKMLLLAPNEWQELEKDVAAVGFSGSILVPVFRSSLYAAIKNCTGECDFSEQTVTEEQYDFNGKRILLAEDNDLNLEIAQELLSEVGFTTDVAENGKICADKFEASPVGWYDAILMDIRMPIMNGYEATEVIRKLPRADAATVPIIAMSADAFSEDVKRCIACGMNSHIAKPIDMSVVSRELGKFIFKNRKDTGEDKE